MRIGELFAGYGGLGLAVQAVLGGEIAWVSDNESGPSKILAHRLPGVPNLGDITTVNWHDVEHVDVMCGGSPCQDISLAGRMAGMTDSTRSNLWVSMREAIATQKPRIVVWENVGGAANARATSDLEPCPGCMGGRPDGHMRALGRVLGDLATLGFDAEWICLRASDVGGCHGRPRIFLFAAHPGRGGWPTGWATRSSQAQTGGSQANPPRSAHAPVALLLPTPAVNDMGSNKATQAAKHGNSNGHGKSLTIEALRLFGTPRASEWKGCGPLGSPSHTHRLERHYLDAQVLSLPAEPNDWGVYRDAVQRWEYLTRPAPQPTEVGRTGKPRLSARFPEWMMGLPDGWITDTPGITRAEALKAAGNGVVPQQAAAALTILMDRITP